VGCGHEVRRVMGVRFISEEEEKATEKEVKTK
jgi:hypothetical protein